MKVCKEKGLTEKLFPWLGLVSPFNVRVKPGIILILVNSQVE